MMAKSHFPSRHRAELCFLVLLHLCGVPDQNSSQKMANRGDFALSGMHATCGELLHLGTGERAGGSRDKQDGANAGRSLGH